VPAMLWSQVRNALPAHGPHLHPQLAAPDVNKPRSIASAATDWASDQPKP
jgi:hypothetical protein